MFSLGDYVKIIDKNIEGFITNINKHYITILSKDKNVKVDISEIEKTEQKIKKSNNIKVNVVLSTPPLDEIMIRHQTVDEALYNLDKFIDNAICNKIKIVKIIHGKNGGILRREVHKYLESSPYVKEHRLGGYYEGSYGVTIAFLR